MRRKETRLRLMFLGSLIVVTAVILYRIGLPATSGNLTDALERMLTECPRSSPSYVSCLRSKSVALLQTFDQKDILPELERIFREHERLGQAGWVSCHDVAHIIGEADIRRGTGVGDALVSCKDNCGFGCSHGTLFAYMQQNRISRDEVGNLCASFSNGDPPQAYDACIHGLGHAVTELAAHRLDDALTYCDGLSEQYIQEQCAAGVFMEMIGSADLPGPIQYMGMAAFCREVPERYRSACAGHTGENSLSRIRDVAVAVQECGYVAVSDRDDCIVSLANILYFHWDGDADRLVAFCGGLPAPLVQPCLVGAIQSDVITNPRAIHSVAICSALSGEARRNCFLTLGQKMAYVYGEKAQADFCSIVPAEDSVTCRISPLFNTGVPR